MKNYYLLRTELNSQYTIMYISSSLDDCKNWANQESIKIDGNYVIGETESIGFSVGQQRKSNRFEILEPANYGKIEYTSYLELGDEFLVSYVTSMHLDNYRATLFNVGHACEQYLKACLVKKNIVEYGDELKDGFGHKCYKMINELRQKDSKFLESFFNEINLLSPDAMDNFMASGKSILSMDMDKQRSICFNFVIHYLPDIKYQNTYHALFKNNGSSVPMFITNGDLWAKFFKAIINYLEVDFSDVLKKMIKPDLNWEKDAERISYFIENTPQNKEFNQQQLEYQYAARKRFTSMLPTENLDFLCALLPELNDTGYTEQDKKTITSYHGTTFAPKSFSMRSKNNLYHKNILSELMNSFMKKKLKVEELYISPLLQGNKSHSKFYNLPFIIGRTEESLSIAFTASDCQVNSIGNSLAYLDSKNIIRIEINNQNDLKISANNININPGLKINTQVTIQLKTWMVKNLSEAQFNAQCSQKYKDEFIPVDEHKLFSQIWNDKVIQIKISTIEENEPIKLLHKWKISIKNMYLYVVISEVNNESFNDDIININ